MALAGESKIHIRKIYENGELWPALLERAAQLAKLPVDIRGVADDLGDAEVGHVFSANNPLLACGLHFAAAEAEETGLRQSGLQSADEFCAVVVA